VIPKSENKEVKIILMPTATSYILSSSIGKGQRISFANHPYKKIEEVKKPKVIKIQQRKVIEIHYFSINDIRPSLTEVLNILEIMY